jgi:hypothetical protein
LRAAKRHNRKHVNKCSYDLRKNQNYPAYHFHSVRVSSSGSLELAYRDASPSRSFTNWRADVLMFPAIRKMS